MSGTAEWQPDAPISNLLKRAQMMAEIRRFFHDRGVLEVETPYMSQATVTDIHLFPFETRFVGPGAAQGIPLYLMTSPEYHMKRLLAAGSGPIFQTGRCFRNEESGRYHNPEFTMLEWYRPHFDMWRLMDEVDDLMQQLLGCPAAERFTWQQIFIHHLQIDPLKATVPELQKVASQLGTGEIAEREQDRDTLLQLLFTAGIEPAMDHRAPIFVYHFPASMAALARLCPEDNRVAKRFELYYKGIELANGYDELTDWQEQERRFHEDNRIRAERGLPVQPLDYPLLEALKAGLPACSGVALGVDRLAMLMLNAQHINEVVAFTVERA
ncbi:MAG: elongation factor P--(R)-beta-lysine ligase [Enterobacteriaceae bacterium]